MPHEPPQTMKSKQFEEECTLKITGWLWDESWREDYQERVTLTVEEMRYIANLMRKNEGRMLMEPRKFSERAAKASAA